MDARCDRCGAPVKQMWSHPDGQVLTFCEHHGREHRYALAGSGWRLVVAVVTSIGGGPLDADCG